MQVNVIEQTDDYSLVALTGRLDMVGVQEIEEEFLKQTAERRKHTIVDLVELEFLSSFGMGMLMKCASVLKLNDARLVLLNPQELITELLETSGLNQFFEVFDDKDKAILSVLGR